MFTQDEIIEITKRSGLGMLLEVGGMDKCLEAFAKLVEEWAAAREREACAKVCDELPLECFALDAYRRQTAYNREQIAKAIRARAQADRGEA